MNHPWLVLETDPPLRLLGVQDRAPGLAEEAITGIGAIRRPADGSETANVSIELDNADGFISQRLAIPPLRVRATLYGPDGAVWFAGALASVTLGETATLTLEG